MNHVHWSNNLKVEISGGNAEQKTSGLHNSFGKKTMEKAPVRKESTRLREAFFTSFAEDVMKLDNPHKVPIQLSGGFRSRNGMADAIESGVCDMIGLGRASVLQPELPKDILLNPAIADDDALAVSHIVKGLWFANWFPIKVVGAGFGVSGQGLEAVLDRHAILTCPQIQYFYYNMRRMGKGYQPNLNISVLGVVVANVWESLQAGVFTTLGRLFQGYGRVKTD
jgi:hypothetical protein